MATEIREIDVLRSDDQLISMLEGVLERARNGDVIGVALVTLNRKRRVGHGYSGAENDFYRLIGGIEELKTRLLKNHSEHS